MLDQYDCLVIGGGPAGSTAAALVAAAGHRTLLVEAERLPRYRVGESLVPECYWTLKRLGVLEEIRRAEFTRRSGVTFVSSCGRQAETLLYQDVDVRECATSWNVERDRFDQMLVENAARHGVDCRDETRALEIRFEGERAIGAVLQTPGGKVREVAARVVVDAGGVNSLFVNTLGLRVNRPHKQRAAVWGYYRGARREAGPCGSTTTILRSQGGEAWFWQTPLLNDLSSIGVVASHEYLLAGRGSPASVLEDELVRCPALAERLMNAQLAGDIRVFREPAFVTQRQAGPGWLLVGDALGFTEPIFLSGVYLALKSGELAAGVIDQALRESDLSAESLGRWIAEFRAGAGRLTRLAGTLGARDFDLGAYLRDLPERREGVTSLLMGRVFLPEAEAILGELERVAFADVAS